MAQSIKGLRLKPKYEDLIGVAVSDELRNIKFPNRDATFLRNGFILSQLDGEGARIMERQQEMASKEAYKEHLLRQIARNNSDNISHHSFRTANESDLREQRINNMLHGRATEANNTEFFDISDNTAEGGTQTDQLPSNDNYVHVEDHRMQIEALQQEAYNREVEQEAFYRNNLQLVQQDARRELLQLEGSVLHQQEMIQHLTAHMHIPARTIPQAITDQKPQPQAIEYQPPQPQAIEDQPVTQSSSSSSHQAQPTHLFSRSITDLLMIKGKTKASWAKANKKELQDVLKDFNIPFDPNEKNLQLYNKIVSIFEQNGG